MRSRGYERLARRLDKVQKRLAPELREVDKPIAISAAVEERELDLKGMLRSTAVMLHEASKAAHAEGDRKNLASLAREAIGAATAYLRAVGEIGPDVQVTTQIAVVERRALAAVDTKDRTLDWLRANEPAVAVRLAEEMKSW